MLFYFEIEMKNVNVPTETIKMQTLDYVNLVGTFVPAKKPNAPALLLLHMLGQDRWSFAPIYETLRDAGYALMSIDFRGHGQSINQGTQKINWETFSSEDWQKLLLDVQSALVQLKKQHGVDSARIGILGASIGANFAAKAASEDPRIKCAFLLSPGLDYRGVRIEEALQNLSKRPVVIFAAKEDKYSFESAQKMQEIGENVILEELEGDAHGTILFSASPEVNNLIVKHLKKYLPA